MQRALFTHRASRRPLGAGLVCRSVRPRDIPTCNLVATCVLPRASQPGPHGISPLPASRCAPGGRGREAQQGPWAVQSGQETRQGPGDWPLCPAVSLSSGLRREPGSYKVSPDAVFLFPFFFFSPFNRQTPLRFWLIFQRGTGDSLSRKRKQ